MTNNKGFEKGTIQGVSLETALSPGDVKKLHEFLETARQPEIDALKKQSRAHEVTVLKTELQLMVEQRESLWQEIDALKAEVARLESNLDTLGRELTETEEENGHYERELLRLKAEAEKLRADAERLDFLDSNKRFHMGWSVAIAPVGNLSVTSIIMGGLQIREALDNAMKETK